MIREEVKAVTAYTVIVVRSTVALL